MVVGFGQRLFENGDLRKYSLSDGRINPETISGHVPPRQPRGPGECEECSPPLVREKLLAHELLVNLLLKLQVNDEAGRVWSDRDSRRWKSDPFEHEPNARNDALCLSLGSGGDLHSLSLSHEMWQQRPTHGSRLCVPQSPFTRTLLGSVVSKSVQERRPSILI